MMQATPLRQLALLHYLRSVATTRLRPQYASCFHPKLNCNQSIWTDIQGLFYHFLLAKVIHFSKIIDVIDYL